MPSFFPPFLITSKALTQLDRLQRRHQIKFSCRIILQDELTENIIQPLQVYEKHILMYAVYISQQNMTFNKRIIKPVRIVICILKK